MGKKKVTILTGGGISVASGVPTFRQQDGFWRQKKQYEGEGEPKKIVSDKFHKNTPWAAWQWSYDFMKAIDGCEPNDGHKAIR